MNLAIFSPSKNPYSETFIQAHKKYLSGNIFYYYGFRKNIALENHKPIASGFKRVFFKAFQILANKEDLYTTRKILGGSLQKNKIDVALVEYGPHANSLLPILKGSNIPMVVHFHGYDASIKETISINDNYKDLFAYASSIVVVSKKMREMILAIGCPREKLALNTYGAQPEFETVIPRFSKKQFIGIGRFTDKKAPYYTILAFSKVLEKHPDAKLLLAGNGTLKNTCVNLVNYLKINKNVIFLGVITPNEYRDLLSQSLAFVQHSITAINGDMEGTPLAVLEASASGLPVISTVHAGIQDVIDHNETGLLCEEHDVDGMAENMLKLLDDIEFCEVLGQNGKKYILENFNIKRHIDTLDTIIARSKR